MVYDLLMQSAWEQARAQTVHWTVCAWRAPEALASGALNTFSLNDAKLGATAGAVGVLHTHNRRLDFHPHVHMVMPAAAALDADKKR